MHRIAFAAGFAFAVGMGGVTAANAGSILDFIFGWRDRTDIQRAASARAAADPYAANASRRNARSRSYEYDSYEDERYGYGGVEQRRAARGKAKPGRIARTSAPTPKPAPKPALTPKEQLARVIDPVKNPSWHLEDQTLRKGDILVLNDRVVVFTGGALGAPKSYVALSRSKLLTNKERARIVAITGGGPAPALVAKAGPGRQPRLLKSVSLTRPVSGPVLGRGS